MTETLQPTEYSR